MSINPSNRIKCPRRLTISKATEVNDAPEGTGGTTGQGRTNGPNRRNRSGQRGSVPFVSSAERKGFSPTLPNVTRLVCRGTDAKRRIPSERAATLRSVRSGVPGPNGAARAIPTVGRETRGGAGRSTGGRSSVAGSPGVRSWRAEISWSILELSRGGCGAVLDSRRVSPRRVPTRVRFARVGHSRGLTASLWSRRWWR